MELIEKIWHRTAEFLKEYDITRLSELLREFEWQHLQAHPGYLAAGVAILAYLIFKKKFKTLLCLASLLSFLVLMHLTFPPQGTPLPLDKLLTFIGISVVLAVINIYFLFMRGK